MPAGIQEQRLEQRLFAMRKDGLIGFHFTLEDASDTEETCAALNAMLDFSEVASRAIG